MAEDLTSKTVAESSTNGLLRDETRATVPLTRRRKTARQVDSTGYKGDDEDDDYHMSVRREAEASNRPPTGANFEAFVAACMSNDDLVFIQSLPARMRRKQKPIQALETASRIRTDTCTTFGACGSSQNSTSTPDSVGDVQNTGATHHPSDALPPNSMNWRNARDPSQTYNQDTVEPNTCDSNPMYPQSTPMQGPNVHPGQAFDSGEDEHYNPTSSPNARNATEDTQNISSQNETQMYPQHTEMQQLNAHTEPALDADNSSIQEYATANHEDDEAAHRPAAGDGDHTCQPYAVRYREEDDAVDIIPYAVAYLGQVDTDTTDQTDTNTPASSCNDRDISTFDNNLHGSRQVPTQSALDPNPMYGQNALDPNPMYQQNALYPNPMYVPNALNPNLVPNALPEETSCGETR
uniref:Uncharacterized protein n=1 Tax=Branchiostoma floridae TaxID=7739 RepID=C3YDP6_BRAFL|eukprot:XP_002605505.1 hypothetical protein BRAFLDRAFT_92927 [Branchiostoma floridae]